MSATPLVVLRTHLIGECVHVGAAGVPGAPPRSLGIANRLIPLRRPAIEVSNQLDCDGNNVLRYYTTYARHAPHGGGRPSPCRNIAPATAGAALVTTSVGLGGDSHSVYERRRTRISATEKAGWQQSRPANML